MTTETRNFDEFDNYCVMSEQIIKVGKLNMDQNKTNPARQARFSFLKDFKKLNLPA
jgi:hypothetical protein